MKNILFICSANKDRSKTAEDYFSVLYPDIVFDSAGTNKNTCNKLGTNYISEAQLNLATHIYVMETKHQSAIKEVFGAGYYNKITVLDIKDIYRYNDKSLIAVLKSKISF